MEGNSTSSSVAVSVWSFFKGVSFGNHDDV